MRHQPVVAVALLDHTNTILVKNQLEQRDVTSPANWADFGARIKAGFLRAAPMSRIAFTIANPSLPTAASGYYLRLTSHDTDRDCACLGQRSDPRRVVGHGKSAVTVATA